MPRVTKPQPAPRMASSSVVDRPSRGDMVMRRFRRFLRPLVGAFLLLIVIFGLSLVLRSADRSDSLGGVRTALGELGASMGLTVRTIEVTGRENTPEPMLLRALGIAVGQPILGFSVSDARSRVLALGWVADAVVERRLPGTLVVRLIERAPFAVWQDHGRYRLIDRAGGVMGDKNVAQTAHDLSLPLVVGDGAPDAATELFQEMKPFPEITDRLVAAVRIGQERWNLVLKSGATVMLPGENQDDALARLRDLNTRLKLLDRPVQVVDLRLADRVVVRPLPMPAAAGASGKTSHGADSSVAHSHA
ncbi:cell division protein FtsQ/DivIB [Acidisoma cladoniae]|jgi:cell division protein FtsQ|uniref:cell division protein FtsQ/DivIB n=1 Tax=Acidisoma cladoniae TaxID=3040935 RepID=UPI00254D9055|nr:cell division protein FtsQ/DivIB [Acidisoma sp. PAMC 29798]